MPEVTEEPDKNSSLNETPVDVGVLDGDGHHEAADEEHAGGLHEVHARLGCRHYSSEEDSILRFNILHKVNAEMYNL